MRCLLVPVLVAAAGCSGGGVPDAVADARIPAWAPRRAMPVPVQETAVVAFSGRVWVLGGFEEPGGETDRVWIYDPAGDQWSAGPTLPTRSHHLGAVVFGDRLFVVGGLQGLGFEALGDVWSIGDGESTWSAHTPMPIGTARGAAGVAALGDLLYVVGGFRGGVAVSDVSAYSPSGDSWSPPLAPLPGSPRDHLVATAFAGEIVAVGGRNAAVSAITGRVDRYDPDEDRWVAAEAMITARAGCAAAVVGEQLVVAGGEGAAGAGGVFEEVEVYDLRRDRWTSLSPMLTPRHGMGGASVDGVMYVPGGADIAGFGAVSTFESLQISP